jgi:rifampicin phosphotransferase
MLVRFQEIRDEDASRVGGKALGIARLLRFDFQVPAGIVLSTRVFRDFLRRNGIFSMAERGGPELAPAIRAASFGTQLQSELARSIALLGDRLAVRSSAIDEDGPERSFAGLYLTRLDVSPADLEGAIKDCWASFFSAHARSYRGTAKVRPDGMAVIIQRQITPIQAGVLFTINPVSGSWQEMTIESHPGLGENVVSANVIPDFFRIRRPRSLPMYRRISARLRLRVLEARGYSENPIDEGSVHRLCRKSLSIEKYFGCPQDIEWAQDKSGGFWFLQARPITRLPPRRGTEVVWTRQFLGERWGLPATRLGWSEVSPLIANLIDYPQTSRKFLGGSPCIMLHKGAPYLNATVFRHLLFKPPGFEPSPRFLLEMLPPQEEAVWTRRYAVAPDWKVYASILRTTLEEKRWQRFRWNPFTNWRKWDAYQKQLDTFVEQHKRPCLGRAGAMSRIAACRQMAEEYAKVHVCSLLFANIWHQALGWRLEERGFGELRELVLHANKITVTQKANQALWKLGSGTLDLDAFLAVYGHRSSNSWALFAPRWREEPQEVLALARLVSKAEDPAPKDRAALQAVEKATSQLSGSLLYMVRIAQRYLFLREEQRFHFDRLLWIWKKAWLQVEEETGMLLRHLDRVEVDAFLAGGLPDAHEKIVLHQERWKKQRDDWRSGSQPPEFIVGEKPLKDYGDKKVLQGIGVSAGLVRGRARILCSLEDAVSLSKDEILVVPSVDPGWTPLFLGIRGLVMELGGMLSHGAVVAREYRLPAVAGVVGATSRIQNGEWLTMDGERGMVWLETSPSSSS